MLPKTKTTQYAGYGRTGNLFISVQRGLKFTCSALFCKNEEDIVCNNKMLEQECTCFVVSFALRAEKSQNHNSSILTLMSDTICCLAQMHLLDVLETCTKKSTL